MTKSNPKQTTAERRPRFSRAEGIALIARWRSSGLSARAFSEEHNVSVNRLWYWAPIAAAALKAPAKAKSDFHVVTVPTEVAQAQQPQSEIEVSSAALGKAVIVVVPTNTLAESFRAIVEGLEA